MIITLIDQLTGKAIRAPARMIRPMASDDAEFWELFHSRRAATKHEPNTPAIVANGRGTGENA